MFDVEPPQMLREEAGRLSESGDQDFKAIGGDTDITQDVTRTSVKPCSRDECANEKRFAVSVKTIDDVVL